MTFEWTEDSCDLINPILVTNPQVTVHFPSVAKICTFEVTVSDGSWATTETLVLHLDPN